MRFWLAAAAALVVAGCGSDDNTPVNIDLSKPDKGATPEIKSDPTGKYQCLGCNLKTNETKCPKCQTVLKAAEAPKPATAPTTPKSGDTVGKSTTSAVYACPEAGCEITFPSPGACLKHKETQMKLQHFVCAKCSVKETVAGKCSKCGDALKKTLE